jgi:flagellar biosynthesis chaperone FliJ
VKFKHLKNSSLNLSEKFKSGLYEEVISLLEAKPERSREEVQLLAKSYSALGRTTQSLFALINLRGKVSGELDKEIQSGLDALWCRLQSEPHFLESLSVEDLQKAISGFRKKEGSSDLFNQLIQRLTILSLKKKESHHMESTLSLLSAMEFDLGARGFLHLAKLVSAEKRRPNKFLPSAGQLWRALLFVPSKS